MDGRLRATAHKELGESRSAFYHIPQRKDWEHRELGGGWFKTGESDLHTVQRGHLWGWAGL